MTIRELRKACGLTQAEFANSIGVCTGSIAAYESGRTKPGAKVTGRIREVYGVGLAGTDHRERGKTAGRGKGKA